MPLAGEHRRRVLGLVLGFLAAGLAGCAVRSVQPGSALDRNSRWVLFPVRNDSETVGAGDRTASILATLLRVRGLADLAVYQVPATAAGSIPELDDRRLVDRAQSWAKGQGFTYAVTGTVEEWRYRNGVE